MALNVMLDKDGSAHDIKQSSSLFHLIKKTTFDEHRDILQCQRDSCCVIHLLTVFYAKRLTVRRCAFKKHTSHGTIVDPNEFQETLLHRAKILMFLSCDKRRQQNAEEQYPS